MRQNRKKYVSRLGIRWKLFGYMMLFLAMLLGLLWVFQVALFPGIYKSVRISEIKSGAAELAENVDLNRAELQSLSELVADDKHVCAMVLDEKGSILASADVLTDCVIHTMSARNVYTLYMLALENDGENMSSFRLGAFKNLRPSMGDYPPYGTDGAADNDGGESIIYTKVVRSENGNDIIVVLNATVSPVASTIRTLQTELIIITALMVLLAAGLSFILAKLVSAPIVKINNSAKELARGKYDTEFDAGTYREIAELSDTLTYAASELSKTGALQRELIANISHDLRTPLTMITGYAEAMRDIPGENTPENVQIIIDEAQRLSSLVNDLLDISKLQAGTMELSKSEFNLTQTVREVIGRFSKFTEQDGWIIEFKHDCEVVVEADRARILQVIYNFINNAITHSDGDRVVTVTQRITECDGKRAVRIEVADRGAGISPEALPNIWDRYYKVDKTHRRAATGSGLGLSIVKSILDLHGARYGVESEIGNGSVFWFEL